jgi:hypothetical protein
MLHSEIAPRPERLAIEPASAVYFTMILKRPSWVSQDVHTICTVTGIRGLVTAATNAQRRIASVTFAKCDNSELRSAAGGNHAGDIAN